MQSKNDDPNWGIIIGIGIAILIVGLLIGSGGVHLYYTGEGYSKPEIVARVVDVLPIGDNYSFIINGTTPPYGRNVLEVLPASHDDDGDAIATFVIMDKDGYLHLMAIRVPKNMDGEPNFDDPRLIELHEVAIDNPLSARSQYRGEITGKVYWYDGERECWHELAYNNRQVVNSVDCFGQ